MLIGVDIGGTKVAVGVVDRDGLVLARLERAAEARKGAHRVLALIASLVAELRQAHPPVAALGVGSPGQVDSDRGMVLFANDNLPGFTGLDLRGTLQPLVGLPVSVTNDVNAAALAEARLGAGRGARSMLMVMVGTGIGGALVLDGQVYQGSRGLAGELGHLPVVLSGGRTCVCGLRGCLEAYAGGWAIARAYAEASGLSGQALPEIVAQARAGEALARRILRQAGRMLGQALGGLVNTLNPDVLVLGGGVLHAEELLLTSLERGLRVQTMPACYATLSVRRAVSGPDAVLVGAALLAASSTGVSG